MDTNPNIMVNFLDSDRYGCPYCGKKGSVSGLHRANIYCIVRCAHCRKRFGILFSSRYMQLKYFAQHSTVKLLLRQGDQDMEVEFDYDELVEAAVKFQPIVSSFNNREYVLQRHPFEKT